MVLKYKEVDVSNLKLGTPVKIGGVYMSKVSYGEDRSDFNIQTSLIELSDNRTIKFNLVKKGQLFTCFEDIYNKLVDILYTNSNVFFGKSFSEKRIQDSLTKIVSIDDNVVNFTDNLISYEKDIKVYNYFRDIIDFNDSIFPVNAIVIMNIDSLQFKGKTIKPIIKITHIKIDYSSNKKKITTCILNDSSSETSDTEECGKQCESKNEQDELDVIVENVDSDNYFDDEI